MPTYQYACKDCGHAFDQFQSFSDDALSVCPVCEGRLRKVFNAVGVVFKGSGFYRNDSRAASTGSDVPAASSESSGSSDTKTSSNGSSGSTPATGSSDKPSSTTSPAQSPAKTSSKSSGNSSAA